MIANVAECTPEQGAQWQAQHSDGARAGRGDARWGREPRVLIEIPADLPSETGAQYVTRHLADAWAIGYTQAWRFASR